MSLLAFQDIVLNVRRAAYLKWRRSVTTLTVPYVRGSCVPNTGGISYVDATRIRSSNLSENDHDADSNLDDSNLDEYQGFDCRDGHWGKLYSRCAGCQWYISNNPAEQARIAFSHRLPIWMGLSEGHGRQDHLRTQRVFPTSQSPLPRRRLCHLGGTSDTSERTGSGGSQTRPE